MASEKIHSAVSSKAVTPSDTAFIEPVPRAIWCDVGGTLAVEYENGWQDTLTVTASNPIEIQPVRVLSTGTTATGIHALY